MKSDSESYAGTFLAIGIMLSRPISDRNRRHFSGLCLKEADNIFPGIVDVRLQHLIDEYDGKAA